MRSKIVCSNTAQNVSRGEGLGKSWLFGSRESHAFQTSDLKGERADATSALLVEVATSVSKWSPMAGSMAHGSSLVTLDHTSCLNMIPFELETDVKSATQPLNLGRSNSLYTMSHLCHCLLSLYSELIT